MVLEKRLLLSFFNPQSESSSISGGSGDEEQPETGRAPSLDRPGPDFAVVKGAPIDDEEEEEGEGESGLNLSRGGEKASRWVFFQIRVRSLSRGEEAPCFLPPLNSL